MAVYGCLCVWHVSVGMHMWCGMCSCVVRGYVYVSVVCMVEFPQGVQFKGVCLGVAEKCGI